MLTVFAFCAGSITKALLAPLGTRAYVAVDSDQSSLSAAAVADARRVEHFSLCDGAARLCTALSLSSDGSLLVAGFQDKHLAIADASRPTDAGGAAAQFVLHGEVTATATGPGLTPWPERNAADLEYMGSEAAAGDGFGTIATIITGDTTGHVYTLKVRDVTQMAQADRVKELLEVSEAEKARAAAAARKLAEEEAAAAAAAAAALEASKSPTGGDREGDDDGSSTYEETITADVLGFPNGRMAVRVLAPRCLVSGATLCALVVCDMGRIGSVSHTLLSHRVFNVAHHTGLGKQR